MKSMGIILKKKHKKRLGLTGWGSLQEREDSHVTKRTRTVFLMYDFVTTLIVSDDTTTSLVKQSQFAIRVRGKIMTVETMCGFHFRL